MQKQKTDEKLLEARIKQLIWSKRNANACRDFSATQIQNGKRYLRQQCKHGAVQLIFTSIENTSPGGMNVREEGPSERENWQPTGDFQVRRQYEQNL